MISLREIAQALGGEVNGDCVRAPGPGHSKHDRSLKVTLWPRADHGFVVHSHAGDDWKLCRDHVMQRLGLSREGWPKKARRSDDPSVRTVYRDQERYAKARELWHGARTNELRDELRLVYPKLFKDDAAWNEAFRMANT